MDLSLVLFKNGLHALREPDSFIFGRFETFSPVCVIFSEKFFKLSVLDFQAANIGLLGLSEKTFWVLIGQYIADNFLRQTLQTL